MTETGRFSKSLQMGLVLLVALLASVLAIKNAFTLDDVALIQDNLRVHSIANWRDILTRPYWPPPFAQDLYRPVMSILHAVQFMLGSGSPIPFRLVSIALYAGTSLMVLLLSQRLLPDGVAFAVAMLFAAHPVHVEAVAPAVNQGELIVAMLAMFAVMRYVDRRRSTGLSIRDWSMLSLAVALAALTKENGFMIPAMLVCAELTIVDGPSPLRRVVSQWKGFASMAVMCALLLWARTQVLSGDTVGAFTTEALVGATTAQRVMTTLQVVPQWFRLLLWPAHLQMDYSPDELVRSTSMGAMEILGLLLVIMSIATAFMWRRRVAVYSFGVMATAIALFPVSNLLVVSSILLAERTMLLPSVWFLLAVGSIVEWRMRASADGTRWRQPIVAVVAFAVIVGTVRSAQRELVWRNPVRLWHAASIEAPKSKRVQQARRDAAQALMRDYEPRIAASAAPWETRRELASLLHAMGDDSGSVDQFRLVVAVHPDHRAASLDLASLLIAFGRAAEARDLAKREIAKGDTSSSWQQMLIRADSLARR